MFNQCCLIIIFLILNYRISGGDAMAIGEPVIESGEVLMPGRSFNFTCSAGIPEFYNFRMNFRGQQKMGRTFAYLTNHTNYRFFDHDSTQRLTWVLDGENAMEEIWNGAKVTCILEVYTDPDDIDTYQDEITMKVEQDMTSPIIHYNDFHDNFYKGETSRLVCESFNAVPDIEWRKEIEDATGKKVLGPPLSNVRRLKVPRDGTTNDALELTIANANYDDAGVYYCGYKSMAYIVTGMEDLENHGFFKKFTALVKDKRPLGYNPKIKSENKMLPDRPFLFSCHVLLPKDKLNRLYWMIKKRFDNVYTKIEELGEREIHFTEDTFMVFENWTTHNTRNAYWDGSSVKCVVEQRNIRNYFDVRAFTDEVTMTVVEHAFSKPKIHHKRSEVILNKGDNFSLICEGNEFDLPLDWGKVVMSKSVGEQVVVKPVERTWYFKIPYGRDFHDGAELYLENVDYRNVGNYSCGYSTMKHVQASAWDLYQFGIMTTIYISVREYENLHTPLESEYIIINKNADRFIVPCVPSFAEVMVSLYYRDYKDKEKVMIYPKYREPFIKYSPRSGMAVSTAFFNEKTYEFMCVFEFIKRREEQQVSVLFTPSVYKLDSPTLGNFLPAPVAKESRTLYCRLLVKKPMRIDWFSWKGPASSLRTREFDIVETRDSYQIVESQLYIERVGEESEGVYTCQVGGTISGVEFTAEANRTLYVLVRPTVVPEMGYMKGNSMRFDDEVVADFGSSLTMVCKTDRPVVWRREFMDPPDYDVTKELNHFYAETEYYAQHTFLPNIYYETKLRGQTEIQVFDRDNSSSVVFIKDAIYPFISKITIYNLTAKDAGYYFCVPESSDLVEIEQLISRNEVDALYVYVVDTKRLRIPSVKDITVLEGTRMIIPCRPSFKEVKVELTNLDPNDEDPVKNSQYDNTRGFFLSFFHIYNEMKTKRYKCTLSIPYITQSVEYRVHIIPSAVIIDIPEIITSNDTIHVGHYFSFRCVARCDCLFNVHIKFPWGDSNNYNEGVEIIQYWTPESNTTDLELLTIVNIEKVTLEHEGLYECVMTDFHRNTAMDSLYLTVVDKEKEPPVIEPSNGEITVEERANVTAYCKANYNATWYMLSPDYRPNGDKSYIKDYYNSYMQHQTPEDIPELLPLDPRKFIQKFGYRPLIPMPHRSSLVITDTRPSDVGYYYCVAHEVGAPKERLSELIRKRKATPLYVFVKNTNTLAVNHGSVYIDRILNVLSTDNFTIPCRPTNKNVIVGLQMDKPKTNDSIRETLDVTQRFVYKPTEGFEIPSTFHNLMKTNFYCSFGAKIPDSGAVAIIQESTFDIITISDVVYKPQISATRMIARRRFEISCIVDGANPYAVFRIFWLNYPTKEEDEYVQSVAPQNLSVYIEKDEHYARTIYKRVFLVINSPEPKHQGYYACKMEDAYGNERVIRKYIKLHNIDNIPPEISIRAGLPEEFGQVEESSTLRLSCRGKEELLWTVPSIDDRYNGDFTNAYNDIKNKAPFRRNNRGLHPPPARSQINNYFDDEEKVLPFRSELIIPGMTVADAGFYSCIYRKKDNGTLIIEYMAEVGIAERFYVFVKSKTKNFVPTSYTSLMVRKGSNFIVPCRPTHENVSVTMHSSIHSHVMDPYPDFVQFSPFHGYTVFGNIVHASTALIFTCVFVSKDYSKIEVSNYTIERVLPPLFARIEFPVEIVAVKITEDPYTLTMTCRARSIGDVPFAGKWILPNNKTISQTIFNENSVTFGTITETNFTLTVTNFDSDNSGKYVCERRDINNRRHRLTVLVVDLMNLDIDQSSKALGYHYEDHMFCGEIIDDPSIHFEKFFPWIASIGYRYCRYCNHVEYICSGALINERYVLTIAQCIHRPYIESLPIVKVGQHKYYKDQEMAPQVIEAMNFIYLEKNFRKEDCFDLALIQLERSVVYSDYVYPVCLHRSIYGNNIMSNQRVYYLSTWIWDGIPGYSNMTGVMLALTDHNRTDGTSSEYFKTTGNQVTCGANNGTPLVAKNLINGKWHFVLVGLLVGNSTERQDCPIVNRYISTLYHYPFIIDQMMKLEKVAISNHYYNQI